MMVYSSKLSCKRTNCRLIWCIPWHSSNIADWRIRSLEWEKKKIQRINTWGQRTQGSLNSRKVRHNLEIKHGGQWDKLQLPSSGQVRELGMWPGSYQPQGDALSPCSPLAEKLPRMAKRCLNHLCLFSSTMAANIVTLIIPNNEALQRHSWQVWRVRKCFNKKHSTMFDFVFLPSRALRSLKSKINGDSQGIRQQHSHNLSQVISISKSPNLSLKIHKVYL